MGELRLVEDAELTPAERATTALVSKLVATGHLRPLIEALRDGDTGPEDARDALRLLADYDVDRLVQIALDTLITEYIEDPGLAHQPRRVPHGDDEEQPPV
jgi:hypothetical protein